jgi:zinc transport system substrate-binding protein
MIPIYSRRFLAGTVVVLSLIGAVAPPATAASKRSVVAAFYPVAYAAQRVGGNRVTVTNLTPAGAEPHDLELTSAQIDKILGADVVFDLGHRFQPAVEKAAAQRNGPTVSLLDTLPIGAAGKTVKAGDATALDPHVWLDPVLMRDLVQQVQRSLTKADPKGRAAYTRNADQFVAELDALNGRYAQRLATCDRKLIVTAHEAFGYLAHRYGLRQEGVAGISPDAEPDAQRLGQLADLVKQQGVTTVFTESLVSPRIADTLAREAGVKTDVLNPLEGLTDKEVSRGANYVTVMNQNLEKLRRALGCT